MYVDKAFALTPAAIAKARERVAAVVQRKPREPSGLPCGVCALL